MAYERVVIADESVSDVTAADFGAGNPFPVQVLSSGGTSTLANGAETAVAGSALQVLAANASRKWAAVQNTGAANVRVGVSGVAATTGLQLVPGAMLTLEPPLIHVGAIFAIREGSTSSTVLAMEAT